MPDMNSKYVEKVLSHIGKGTARAELKYELESHVDERCSYFQSLGYDEETALEKAEEAMGDPDIAGEQFYLQIKGEKRKNALYVFIAIATALLNLLYYFIPVDPLFDGSIFDIYFSEFWVFVASAVVYTFTLFNIILGFKKKKALNLVSALLFGWLSNFLFILCFVESIYCTCVKVDFAYYFIYKPYTYTGDIDNIIMETTQIVSIIVMALINIAGLVIIVKTRWLKNTKKDLVFSKIVKTALGFWIVVCVLFTAITGIDVNSRYKSVPEDFENNAIQYEATFLDNVDRFINIDEDEFERTLKEMFPEDSYVHYSDKGYPYHVGDTPIITAYWDSTVINKIVIDFDCNVNNPFSIFYSTSSTENRYALTQSDIRQDMTINDAPLPADVSLYYNDESDAYEMIFEYANDEEEYTFLQFTYDPETQSFNLTESHAPNQ